MEMNALLPQAMIDRLEIIDVVTRYAVGIDLKKWDDFGSCFADQIDLNIISAGGWVTFSREKIVDYARRTFSQYDATQHISANHQVTVDGDAAVCISTLNATHYIANEPGGPTQRQLGYYTYELSRHPEWRIHRVIQMLGWQEGNQGIFDRAHEDVGLPERAPLSA